MRRINQKEGTEGRPRMTRQTMVQKVQKESVERKMLVEVKKLVTFIAGVIDATMEIRNRENSSNSKGCCTST